MGYLDASGEALKGLIPNWTPAQPGTEPPVILNLRRGLSEVLGLRDNYLFAVSWESHRSY